MTASDLLRLFLTLIVAALVYGRLGVLLRALLPGRVRHRVVPGAEPQGLLVEALRREGFQFLGYRAEDIWRLHARRAAVFVHPGGRIFDLAPSGRLLGSYVVTFYEGGRCALTRVGSGRDIDVDRYRSRALRPAGRSLPDVLEAHAELENTISLGAASQPATSLDERLALARRWYADHARSELWLPALLDGALTAGLIALTIYVWTV